MFDDYFTLKCENLTIKQLPASNATSLSTVSPIMSSYNVGETIGATFYASVAIQNSWIGVYRVSDADNSMNVIPEPLAWIYTACNNVAGDQNENNDCAARKTSGLVHIDGRFGSDRWLGNWPLPIDTYHVCLSFYDNEPFEKFVCSEGTFLVVYPQTFPPSYSPSYSPSYPPSYQPSHPPSELPSQHVSSDAPTQQSLPSIIAYSSFDCSNSSAVISFSHQERTCSSCWDACNNSVDDGTYAHTSEEFYYYSLVRSIKIPEGMIVDMYDNCNNFDYYEL